MKDMKQDSDSGKIRPNYRKRRLPRPPRRQAICAIIIIIMKSCTTEAFISPSSIIDNHRQRTIYQSQINRHYNSIRKARLLTSSSLYAASAWLFTPDRTAGVLVDSASDALLSTANAATDAALEVAAHAVDIATTVTTDTVVQTIYKAPFISLAISFLLGGLFFSTVAAVVASIIALGKENTRRMREVFGIVYRRNWSVLKLSVQFTMVSL